MRLLLHLFGLLGADHVDRELDEIAHHRLDVAADVADLGELRRLDLDEGRLRQARQPARDLGLADAGRADHQDVLRRHLFGHLGRQLLPAHAVAQRDRHRALRLGLADDVLVELGDDLARRQRLLAVRGCVREDKMAIAVLQFFDRQIGIRINADVGGDRHRLDGDLPRVELAVTRERPRRRHRERPPRSDRHDPVVGLDQIAGAGEQKRRLLVGDDEHRLEPAKQAVGAPVARELDGGAFEVAAILLELRFEAREERKGVGGRAGEAGQDARCRAGGSCARAA